MSNRRQRDGLAESIEKMESASVPRLAQEIFRRHYEDLQAGTSGTIPENDIKHIDAVHHYDELTGDYGQLGRDALQRTAVLKLNGGLGTTMGLNGPKSLLEVKDNLSFLQIFTRQIAQARRQHNVILPLILLNSFSTHDQTLAALRSESVDSRESTMTLVQNQIPKLWQRTLTPAKWPIEPAKEWCPPGHGDLFASLTTSQALPRLLTSGYEYLFVSNADNLGAVIDERILGYAVANHSPFMMEVAQRTEADRKGGHLATNRNGQLCLREAAQCHPHDQQRFMDITHHRYFNTNNLWIHLPTLQKLLHRHGNVLPLSLIKNTKRIDPKRADSPHVYQLETAAGSAISLFENAQVLSVPRSRFLPVKSNDDLKRLRSNAYAMTEEYRIIPHQHSALSPALKFHFGDDAKELASIVA